MDDQLRVMLPEILICCVLLCYVVFLASSAFRIVERSAWRSHRAIYFTKCYLFLDDFLDCCTLVCATQGSLLNSELYTQVHLDMDVF